MRDDATCMDSPMYVHVYECACVVVCPGVLYEQLAKTVAVGGFIYGFLYTTATGRPAIDISAKRHGTDSGDAADFQVNGMVRSYTHARTCSKKEKKRERERRRG